MSLYGLLSKMRELRTKTCNSTK